MSRSQRSASKRKADHTPPSGRKTRKKSHVEPSRASDNSEEHLFKLRNAVEFDSESDEDGGGNQVQVKQEQQDEETAATSSRQRPGKTQSVTPYRTRARSAAKDTPSHSAESSVFHDDVNQESVFVAILSQTSWDLKITQSAIENLSQHARQVAGEGQLFDTAYVDSIIRRLDRTSIEAERRSQVVELLQQELRPLLDYWTSCIDRIGDSPQPSPATPRDVTSTALQAGGPGAPTLKSSRLLYVDVRHGDVLKTAGSQDRKHSHESSGSMSDCDRASDDGGSESDYVEHKCNSLPRAQKTRSLVASSGQSKIIGWNKPTTNMRLYGTRFPKAAFDILARCLISAWAAAPHPDDTPTNTREYALLRWRKVSGEHKSVWQKLFEDRGDPAIDVVQEGFKLLVSQDLLRAFVPDNRLAAAATYCEQQLENNCVNPLVDGQLPGKNVRSGTPPLQRPREITSTSNAISEIKSSIRHTTSSRITENFPRLTQATADTPIGQACLTPSVARGSDTRTCIFILNSPDTRYQRDLTEVEVRVACQQAGLSGMISVTRQTHSVFVAFFSRPADALRARQSARLYFTAPPDMPTCLAHLCVEPEIHWLEINRVFVMESTHRSVNPDTVPHRVFKALEGPLASSFRLLKQHVRSRNGKTQRTRFILRPSAAVSPIFVERFYIPLDDVSGGEMIWGIFKPVNRLWKCPACGQKCQAGDISTCASAIEMLGYQ